jgi:hypothetical protein
LRNTKERNKTYSCGNTKGNPLIHKIILHTAESGIAEYTIKASFIDPRRNTIKSRIMLEALQPLIWL